MKRAFLTLLTLTLCATSQARLGEDEKQLNTRFGEPVMIGKNKLHAEGRAIDLGPTLHFRDGDWSISCDMIDSRCARISYQKKGSWDEAQITQTLNANRQGFPWKLTSKGNETIAREWSREDGGSGKWVSIGSLTLTNPAYNRAVERAKAKAKAEARKTPSI